MTSNAILLLLIVYLISKFNFVCADNYDQYSNWSLDNLIPKNYNKHIVPIVNGSQPTISVGIEVFDLVSVAESSQSFTLDILLRQTWNDPRMNLPEDIRNDTPIILDNTWSTKIWTPDTYFSNAIEAKVLNIMNPIVYYTILPGNYVIQTVRMIVKFQCKMDLSQYPQDVQYCPIDLVSLTRSNKSILLKWDYFISPPFDDNPKFRIRDTTTGLCHKQNHLGHLACLNAKMKLVRRVSYYVIRVYAPTFLTTISSFVGFWIPVIAWPARVALLVTPLLTLVTQNVNINSEINVSYVVAVHWWMTICIFFIFMSLIEFAIAISWAWRANDRKALRATQGITEVPKTDNYINNSWYYRCGRIIGNILVDVFGNIDYTKDPLSRNKVDYVSRIIFPLFFLLFVLIYIFSTVCPWAVDYNW